MHHGQERVGPKVHTLTLDGKSSLEYVVQVHHQNIFFPLKIDIVYIYIYLYIYIYYKQHLCVYE